MATNHELVASIVQRGAKLLEWPEDELGPIREELKEADNIIDNALAIMKGD